MLFAWPKSQQPQPRSGEALAFVQALAVDAALPFVVLAAAGRPGFEVATFAPRSADIAAWIAKRAARKLYMLTAQSSGPLSGRAISEADLVQTRIVAVAVPISQEGALDAFGVSPAVIARTPRDLTAAWRLRNPTSPTKARELASQLAAYLGGAPIGPLFPLPGCGGIRLLQHLKGPRHWALVTDFDTALAKGQPEEEAVSGPLFVSAASIKPEPIDWLWPNVIARGALTLIAGKPGMGKSQIAVRVAATVSRGGEWPDGSLAAAGASIICELEDDPARVVAPRLLAAGADMSRIEFGQHMDLATGLAPLRAKADAIPDLQLLVLSPVLTFFGSGALDEVTMRAKLKPLLELAAERRIAVLGITHPPKGARGDDAFAGSEVFLRAARAAWSAIVDDTDPEPIVKRKRRLLVSAKNNLSDDTLRMPYRIEGVDLPDGIETSRVVFAPATVDMPVTSKPAVMLGINEARAWILEFLAEGPQDSGLVKAKAKEAGIKETTLERAANAEGVIRDNQPGTKRKVWRLP